MSAPKLHAVTSDEVAQPDPPAPPKTLVEATERSRREFLVMARRKIATEIDAGVPSHALGRLIAEMDRLDTEVRRMDAADEREAARGGPVSDEAFDASAV